MADNTWTNGGGTGNATWGGNWSLGHKPTGTETAVFDGTSSAICNLFAGSNITCLNINMTSAYGGSFRLQASTFVYVTGTNTIDSEIQLNAASAYINFYGGSLAIGSNANVNGTGYLLFNRATLGIVSNAGGSITCGRIQFSIPRDGGEIAAGTYGCDLEVIGHASLASYSNFEFITGTYSFSNVKFTSPGSALLDVELTSNPAITITGNLTIDINSTGGIDLETSSNALILQGDLINEITGSGVFDPSNLPLTFSGTADQDFDSCGATWGGLITVNKAGDVGLVTFSDDCTANGITGTAGNIDFGAGFDHTWNGPFYISYGGTMVLGNGTTHTFYDNVDQRTTGAWNRAGSTFVLAGTSKTWYSVSADRNYNFTITGTYTASGTVRAEGLVLAVTGSSFSGSIRVYHWGDDADLQVQTGATFTPTSGCWWYTGSPKWTQNDGIGPYQAYVNLTTLAVFSAMDFSNLTHLEVTEAGNLSFLAGTVTLPNLELSTVTAQHAGLDLTNNPSITILGDFTIDLNSTGNITIVPSNNAIELRGDLINEITGGGTFTSGNQDITLANTNNQNVDWCGVTWGDIEIDKSSGTVVNESALTCPTFTGVDGIFDPNGQTITTSGIVDWQSAFDMISDADAFDGCSWIVGGDFTADGQTLNATASWTLSVVGSAVASGTGAVAYSNASGGTEIIAFDGPWTDNNNNINWDLTGDLNAATTQLLSGLSQHALLQNIFGSNNVYGSVDGLNFMIHLDDGLDLNINRSGYMLGFFGGKGPSSTIIPGTWNGTTYVVDSIDNSAKTQGRNLKYTNATQVYVDGATDPIALTKVPNYQSTLNIRFKHASAVQAWIARCRFYDRTKTVDDAPTGVDIKLFEIAHYGVRQVVPSYSKSDSTWSDGSSGEWIEFSRSPGSGGIYGGTTSSYPAKEHDWFVGMSVSPNVLGSRSNIGFQFSVEYL